MDHWKFPKQVTLQKNDHLHLTKYNYEKLITLCQQTQIKFNSRKSTGATIWL